MPAPADPLPSTPPPLLGWRRVLLAVAVSVLLGLMHATQSVSPTSLVVGRTIVAGIVVMLAYGLVERWPRRPPRRLSRWAVQLIGVVVAVPLGAWLAYAVTTGGDPAFTDHPRRFVGFGIMCLQGFLFAPWIALGAMVRQRDAFVRDQALAFALERSELERKALDARLRLLQAQVEPHFLFNTLANVQALVVAGSPQAPKVLESLIAYLRAAVPRLAEPATTLGAELALVRAYLDLMHMRMPDRLVFAIDADERAASVACPPMTLLTLVENAIRHGIDPSEDGGRIDVEVRLRDGCCHVAVTDSGVGLRTCGDGPGTGLAALRERLELAFGGAARLRLADAPPHGVRAELELPVREAAA